MSNGRRATLRSGPRFVMSGLRTVARSISCACVALLFMAGPVLAGPPGAVISNQASLQFVDIAGQPSVVFSNEVSVTTAVVRSPASIEFVRVVGSGSGSYQETVGPSACLQSGVYVPLADPFASGIGVVDPSVVQDTSPTSSYNPGESAFIRLLDLDQNLDYLVIENVVVSIQNLATGDSETVQLTETGPNTGIFAGYIPLQTGPATSGDCVLQGTSNSSIQVSYVDPQDSNDLASDAAGVDPLQRVFESQTGALIDGATIQIVDAVSGLPATVYGNDGISQFPSTIVSGGTVTDSSGTVYSFATGEYRFPVVPDGDYRLLVTPPTEYSAPSSASITDLQNLPGQPWLLSAASFGATFSKNGELSFAVDIPVDPISTALFLQKRTLTTTAAPGDFVRYELTLENASIAGPANSVNIQDQLPAGVRYVEGSTRRDGAVVEDPTIDSSGSLLTFDIPPIQIAARIQLSYVVEIVAGGRDVMLVNSATAFAAGGIQSNESTAAIRLTEDLFRTTATIIGRVLAADCSQETFAEDQGVANVRVYLEDGRYAVSDDGGRFHFEGVTAGTHVAQIDTFTVPEYYDIVGCDSTPGFAGRADSRFVKLLRGSLQRADFYLRLKERPHGRIDIEMRHAGDASPEKVAYELDLAGIGNVDIKSASVMVVLPNGLSYAPGSLRLDGASVAEPQIVGPSLTIALPDQTGLWNSQLRFVANIAADTDGELTTKALAKFSTPMEANQKTPVAETRMLREPAVVENSGYVLDLKFAVLSDTLSDLDKLQLDKLIGEWGGVRDIQINATGHSDSQRISTRNQHLFADNYALSQARAMSAAFYVADALQVPVANIQVSGRGPDDPVADNATAVGRQKNRRVEMTITGLRPKQPSFIQVTQQSSGTKETATVGAIPGMDTKRVVVEEDDKQRGMPASQIEPPIDALAPGYAILLPERGYAPAIASTKISIQHEVGQTVELTINDDPVNKLNFEGMTSNVSGSVAVSRWTGVPLVDGANEIRAVVWNADGSRAKGIRRTIHFTGTPIRAEFVAEKSVLVADGKTNPVIALRLFDRSGKPSRTGMVGRFAVQAPYRSSFDVDNDRKNTLVEIGDRSASYRVSGDGIAYLELAPTTQTGEVTVTLPFENYREQEIRAWLTPAQRDWILVGFAEGTAGYNTISDNVAAAALAGQEEDYYDEGRVAFFAKGSIKGEFLLTLAYDSDRDRDEVRDRFDTVIDPNAYYPLYADRAEQRFEAASQRKLFLKLERNQFYALFGDFETGLSVTDLARYQRRFNGLKSEYRGQNFGYTAFAAETDQSFNRDELRGDGTSGLYRLSNSPIIANSEIVRIEIRDRFDSGVVLSSQTLARFLDYNLDTLNGTLFFKSPVASRDFDFNPIFIVVEYESVAASGDDIVAGARASMSSSADRVEVGVTHINDQTSGAEAELNGVDFRWQINDVTELKAEVSESETLVGGIPRTGTAHSVTLQHSGSKVDVSAFIREVDDGFGLGYQSSADAGVRRVGVDARMEVNDKFSVDGELGWQQNLSTDAVRNVARGLVRYENGDFSARAGLAHANDEFDDGTERTSDLLEVGVAQRLMDGDLRLRVGGSLALNEDAENIDYPSSVIFGADYKLLQGIDLVAEYEDASSNDLDTTMTRIGVRAAPWNRAQLNTFLTNEQSEFGPRLFANVGLIQGFQLNDNWILDVGLDQAKTLDGSAARPFDTDRERTSGSLSDDYVAAYTGATYSNEDWSANARIESRNSDAEDRATLLFGWYRAPDQGHGLSSGLTFFDSQLANGNEVSSANLKFGWAYRLADRQWAFLDRADLIFDRAQISGIEEKSWRLINNFNANRRLGAASELSFQYAFKYVRSNFAGAGYTGYTDLIGMNYRRGIFDKWDIGANASFYHSYQSEIYDYGVGLDVGWNVATNMWLSLGYNFAGFEDKDFSAARYTAAGPFLQFSIKADQHLLKRIAGQR